LWWLSGPVVAGTVAALWAWWTERPERRPTTAGAMRAHGRFLDSLARPAAGTRHPDDS
jgi:hypothetical protein